MYLLPRDPYDGLGVIVVELYYIVRLLQLSQKSEVKGESEK